MSASVAGSCELTYQWKKNGANLSDGGNVSGATTTALTLAAVTTTDGGVANSYTAGVSNSAGTTISSAGVLTVSVPPPFGT